MNNFVGGYRQDSPSDKDYIWRSTSDKLIKVGSTTNEIKLPEYTPISNQGYLSSCVGNSTIDALEILLGIQDQNSVVQLSRLFAYFNSRNYHGETNKDNGTYIRFAFDSLKTYGVCQETTWPYDPNFVFAQPNLDAYKEADDNRIENYYRIIGDSSGRCSDIVTAIDNNHPVVFGAPVGRDFQEDSKPLYDFPAHSIGNHAMIIVGYRYNPKLELLIRNSWGEGWGDKGHAWMTSNYIGSPLCNDFWVPTLVPSLLF